MDHFGIGLAIKAMVKVYEQASCQTGRTTSIVDSLKDGDRVVFTNEHEARRVQRLCKEAGIDIDYIVINPKGPNRILERGTSQGRTIFDHTWVYEYYMDAIELAEHNIGYLQKQLSSYGEPLTQGRGLKLNK